MSATELAIPQQELKEQMDIVRISLGLAQDVPDAVVQSTVLLGLQYGLSATNKEIQILPTGSKKVGNKWVKSYSPYVGLYGLTRSARRTSAFTHQETLMEAGEVKELRGGLYDEDDVGVRVTLWRLDLAKECKSAGIPYHPTEAEGVFRVKANYSKSAKKWTPDSIPNTMSKKSKAAQRALRAAIKKAYDLNIPDELLEPVMSEELTDGDVVEGVVVQLDEDTALLVAYYGLETVEGMDDEQRKFASAKLRSQDEDSKMIAELTPEEKKSRTEQNADHLGMGAKKPKRLGDEADLSNVEPEVVEEEPVEDADEDVAEGQFVMDLDEPKPDWPDDWAAWAMKQRRGLFTTRKQADQAVEATKASAEDEAAAWVLWQKIVSNKIDALEAKESK